MLSTRSGIACTLALAALFLGVLSPCLSDDTPSSRAEAYGLFLDAESLAAEGRLAEARRMLERVLELDPDAVVVRGKLARLCLRAHDEVCAENEAERAIARPGGGDLESYKVLAELAFDRYRAGRDAEHLETGLLHLERATEVDPRDGWAWAVWIRVLGIEGRIEEAETVARRASAVPGLDPAAPWIALARVLLTNGRQQEAIALLDRAEVVDRAAGPILELLADLKGSEGDLAGQEFVLRRLRALRPEDAQVAHRLGKVLLELGDSYGAEAPLREALDARPADPLIRRDLANVLVLLGRGAEALVVLERVPETHMTPHTHLLGARAAEQAGRFADAAERLERLEGRLPGAERESFGNAILRRAARDWVEAGEADRALLLIRAFDGDADSRRTQIAALELLERERDAETLLEGIARRERDNGALIAVDLEYRVRHEPVETALSRVRQRLDGVKQRDVILLRAAGALAAWGEAKLGAELLREIDAPEEFEAAERHVRAGVLLAAGHDDEAEAEYREVLRRQPESHAAMNDLGYLLASHGRSLDEALALCQRAVELQPGQRAYLDSLGWALYKTGRSEEALSLLRRAARTAFEPGEGEIRDHLGDVYAALGDLPRALSEWKAARALGLESEELDAKIERAESSAATAP